MNDASLNLPAAPQVIRREDYRPPEWLVPEIALDFDLDPVRTRVTARLKVERNGGDASLRLNGEGLALVSVTVDGQAADHVYENDLLTLEIKDMKARSSLIAEKDPFIVISLLFRGYSGTNKFTPQIGDYAAVIHEGKI